MADREGKCELPIAPGQLYIEVEYDYEYKAKDKLVTIRQGECYMLVRKTNDDWWQVRKDENTKSFYVPAQYVREVRKALMPPPKPLQKTGSARAKPALLEIHRSNENLNKHPEMSSFGHVSPPGGRRDANQNPGSPGHVQNNNAGSTLPRTRAESPVSRPPPDADAERTPPRCDSAGEGLEKLRNDSESGDDLSSSSTEHMQVRGGRGRSAGAGGGLPGPGEAGGLPGPGEVCRGPGEVCRGPSGLSSARLYRGCLASLRLAAFLLCISHSFVLSPFTRRVSLSLPPSLAFRSPVLR